MSCCIGRAAAFSPQLLASLTAPSPKARIETAVDWHHRRDSDEVYRMPLVVISDRRGGHEGPSASFKPWGDVLRMPVQDNWLENLRDRVLKGYTGPVSLQHPDKPRLVYLSRQDTGRRLDDDQHKNLVIALEDLHDEGVIDFTLLQFVDGTPFPDQLAEFSKTDVRMGCGSRLAWRLCAFCVPC